MQNILLKLVQKLTKQFVLQDCGGGHLGFMHGKDLKI